MKKFISLMLALITILSTCSTVVFGAEILPIGDFTVTEGEGELEGWTVNASDNNSAKIVVDPLDPENMVMELTHDPERTSGAGTIITKNLVPPSSGEMVWTFDIMFAKAEASVYVEISGNGMRLSNSYKAENFGELNTWYSVVVHMKEGCASGNVYKKVKGSEEEYTTLTVNKATTSNNLTAIRFYTTKGKQSVVGSPDVIYVDNTRVVSGLYTENIEFFFEDASITSASEISGEGTVTARYSLMNADLSEESEVLAYEFPQVFPAMLVLDNKGRMLDCAFVQQDLNLLENSVELSVDVSEFCEAAAEGSVKLYLWDSLFGLQALMDEVVLPNLAK